MATPSFSQEVTVGEGQFRYRVAPEWEKLPHGWSFVEAVGVAVVAGCQFAALACGAHPYKIAQIQWQASPVEGLLEKMGIDWQKAKAEFEDYLKVVEAGNGDNLYDPRLMITSGPGFQAGAS